MEKLATESCCTVDCMPSNPTFRWVAGPIRFLQNNPVDIRLLLATSIFVYYARSRDIWIKLFCWLHKNFQSMLNTKVKHTRKPNMWPQWGGAGGIEFLHFLLFSYFSIRKLTIWRMLNSISIQNCGIYLCGEWILYAKQFWYIISKQHYL